MTERLFFASKGIVPERTIALSFEILSRDVFSCSAGFLSENTFWIRTETGKTLLDKTEEKDFCLCGKLIGTLEE